MSNVPKRPPVEGTGSSSSMRHPLDNAGTYSNMKHEAGEDSQVGKSANSKSLHVGKGSPSHPVHHVKISFSEPHSGHIGAGPEIKQDHMDSKEIREYKLSGRDAKVETNELYYRSGKIDKDKKLQGRVDDTKEAKHDGFKEKETKDNKMDSRDTKIEISELYHRGGKTDKDRRFQGRKDDSKEAKQDGSSFNDSKARAKPEKELCGSGSGLPNWKEHQKGKRYDDVHLGVADADWPDLRAHLHGTTSVCKVYPTNKVREQEADGGIIETEAGLKGDNQNGKDRKRKHESHRDWGHMDKGSNMGSLQLVHGGSNIEAAQEEREADRPERDMKGISQDKMGTKALEKGHIDQDAQSTMEKEVSYCETETIDQSTMQECLALEQRKHGEADGRAESGKEAAERGEERDDHVEGERPEKRTRHADKESDSRGAGTSAVLDGEKGSISCTDDQTKGVLCPGDSSPIFYFEPGLRLDDPETNRLQGKQEVATILYCIGECAPELLKVWNEYGSCQVDQNKDSCIGGPTIEIRIPSRHITAANRQVKYGQLWGTDVYTNDSDPVAVLMHTGYCRTSKNPAPPALQEVRVIVRLLPPQDHYISSWRNNVRSRSWGTGIGCSYRVERCYLVKKGCEPIEIERSLTDSSVVEPTLAPISVERPMTTRASASNASRHHKLVKEVTIQYSLSNEPWIKYGLSLVADKGLKKPSFTSARLKKGEALYMETHFNRYELCFTGEKIVKPGSTSKAHETGALNPDNHKSHAPNAVDGAADGEIVDMFRFSRCKKNLPQSLMLQHGIPLPVDLLEVVEENLDWEDVLWSSNGVWVGGKEYQLARIQFLSPTLRVTPIV